MAKKRKKSGVRWVGPAKLVAEAQDSAYGSGGGGDAGLHGGHAPMGGMGPNVASGASKGGSKKYVAPAPAPKPKKKK